MTPVVAVIAPGAMGGAVGKRLVEHGVTVLTSLDGRSEETRTRANAAGMTAAKDDDIARADFILSILPPGDAFTLAQRFVPALTASNAKPVYVDCNAINPSTVDRVAAIIAPTGSPFVDAGIIGQPPKPGDAGPRIYASGGDARGLRRCADGGTAIESEGDAGLAQAPARHDAAQSLSLGRRNAGDRGFCRRRSGGARPI